MDYPKCLRILQPKTQMVRYKYVENNTRNQEQTHFGIEIKKLRDSQK